MIRVWLEWRFCEGRPKHLRHPLWPTVPPRRGSGQLDPFTQSTHIHASSTLHPRTPHCIQESSVEGFCERTRGRSRTLAPSRLSLAPPRHAAAPSPSPLTRAFPFHLHSLLLRFFPPAQVSPVLVAYRGRTPIWGGRTENTHSWRTTLNHLVNSSSFSLPVVRVCGFVDDVCDRASVVVVVVFLLRGAAVGGMDCCGVLVFWCFWGYLRLIRV